MKFLGLTNALLLSAVTVQVTAAPTSRSTALSRFDNDDFSADRELPAMRHIRKQDLNEEEELQKRGFFSKPGNLPAGVQGSGQPSPAFIRGTQAIKGVTYKS